MAMVAIANVALSISLVPLRWDYSTIFEGWYLKDGPRFTGVGAQILGAYDKYICQSLRNLETFGEGTTLRAPTVEAGLAPACKDTCSGDLTLKIWEKNAGGSKGKVHVSDMQPILDVKSDMAALEAGGGPWFNTWKGKTTTPEVIENALQVPVDMGPAPFLKPPGL
ncbi:hypothetical protein F3Y22_tig00109987pilonHSYRG00146 [Hibiscus syriacus]|uniref:Uncharacterized protein n=1 Tax=Hibiscus syriacus TaxID=106335 RepID=A0A6A3BQM5_HIBSY|nr:hypothetical protein F3Y22_tig00109987pilonHSYRG00146 [Hibiscus syriacus]